MSGGFVFVSCWCQLHLFRAVGNNFVLCMAFNLMNLATVRQHLRQDVITFGLQTIQTIFKALGGVTSIAFPKRFDTDIE